MRQQSGLFEYQDRHCAKVRQGGVVTSGIQPGPCRGPAILGAVAQGEQRLLAAQLGTASRDRDDLVGSHEHVLARPTQVRRVRGKGAVVAAVAAEPGQWDEYLRRERDYSGPTGGAQALVAQPGSVPAQYRQIVPAGGQQRHHLITAEGVAASDSPADSRTAVGVAPDMAASLRVAEPAPGTAGMPGWQQWPPCG